MKNTDYVLEVYKSGSFTAASTKLYLSQPALSTAVKKIEEEIGIEIFDRSTSPLRPTDAGMIYINALIAMQKIRVNMENELSDLAGLKTGHVSLGGAHFIAAYLMPEVLIAFARQYPGIDVEVTEGSSMRLQDLLTEEKLDFVMDYALNSELFESKPLFRESILLTVPEELIPDGLAHAAMTRSDILSGRHLGADCPVVSISAFRDKPFLLLKKGNDLYRQAMKIFRAASLEPEVRLYLDQMMTAYNLSQRGMGIALVTDTVVRHTVPEKTPLFFRISEKAITRTLYITWKKKRYVPLAAQEFVRVARETLAEAGSVREVLK